MGKKIISIEAVTQCENGKKEDGMQEFTWYYYGARARGYWRKISKKNVLLDRPLFVYSGNYERTLFNLFFGFLSIAGLQNSSGDHYTSVYLCIKRSEVSEGSLNELYPPKKSIRIDVVT